MILAALFGASAALEEVRVSRRPRARLPSPSGDAMSNLVCHETNPGVQSLRCQRWLTQMMPLLSMVLGMRFHHDVDGLLCS